MVARDKSLPDGTSLSFEDAWARRQSVVLLDTTIYVPSIDDLIVTKRWGSRARDLADIQWLEALKTRSLEEEGNVSADDALDSDAPIPFEEFERRRLLAIAELDGPEGDEMAAFIDWFMRRYPTPIERIRYARKRYEGAMKMRGVWTNPR